MDYQEQDTGYTLPETVAAPSREEKQPPNHMATASLVMGILALATVCCCWGGLIFGGLGILFALLSRGDGAMEGRAKTGLILSAVGIALSILVWGGFVTFSMWTSQTLEPGLRTLPAVPQMPVPGTGSPGPDNFVTIFPKWLLGGV